MDRNEKMKWIGELKRNRCGFFTINDQARGMIEKYWSAIEVRHKGSWQKPWFSFSKIDDGCVCRLRPDFELPEEPKERWFLNIKSLMLLSSTFCEHDLGKVAIDSGWVEITPEQKAYIEKKPEAEDGYDWVLKLVEKDDRYLDSNGKLIKVCYGSISNCVQNIKWVRVTVEKNGQWVEYPIIQKGSEHICILDGKPRWSGEFNLYQLPSIVGFGGVQFLNAGNEWHMKINALWDDYNALCDYRNDGVPCNPATPIKARFWVE